MNYWVVGRRGLIALCALLVVCVASSFVVANRIGRAIFVDSGARQLPVYSVETGEKVVALGFNCAWDDADVPGILEILRENDVKATFFVVGQWAEKYPESLKALSDAGHEIANHSYSHPDMTKLSRAEVGAQIQRCSDAVERVTGAPTTLFRAPSGAYNNPVIEVAREMGYEAVQWDVDSRDWKDPSAADMTESVVGSVQNGSITLFHVGKANTVQALPDIIARLKEKGYSFRPVGEILLRGEYKIDVQGRQRPVS